MLASIFVSIYWVTYSVHNILLPGPPSLIGGITPINLQYILLSALLLRKALAAVRAGESSADAFAFPGVVPYALFVAWASLSLLWGGVDNPGYVLKQMIIHALLGLIAAQGGWGQGPAFVSRFAAGSALVGWVLSLWTIGHAIASGFAYRAGVPINPNFVATLIAPGLLFALSWYLAPERQAGIRRFLALALWSVGFYASVLLGSRGVMIALLGAVVLLVAHARPRRAAILEATAFTLLAILVAYAPAIPLPDLFHGAHSGTESGDFQDLPPVPAQDAPQVAEGMVFARFSEEGVLHLNLRLGLWVEGVRYAFGSLRNLLFGGGMGHSDRVAHQANPVFDDIHNLFLQVVVDYGLIGAALFAWFHLEIMLRLYQGRRWTERALLCGMFFFLLAGLTATVGDLHIYWVFSGLGALAARDVGSGG